MLCQTYFPQSGEKIILDNGLLLNCFFLESLKFLVSAANIHCTLQHYQPSKDYILNTVEHPLLQKYPTVKYPRSSIYSGL